MKARRNINIRLLTHLKSKSRSEEIERHSRPVGREMIYSNRKKYDRNRMKHLLRSMRDAEQ